MSEKQKAVCGFCGKASHEVKKLIAGPTVMICNECVLLCVDILIGAAPIHVFPQPDSVKP